MLSAFEREYRRLNPEQKAAVDAVEGPVMVVAGPGTGKTQILTLRIANILLKTHASPKGILALTFTEHAAANMRRRLTNIVGITGHDVGIFTFHGFAQFVRSSYGSFFTGEDFELITDVSRMQVITDIVTKLNVPLLKPAGDPKRYVGRIGSKLSALKRENRTPEDFAQILKSLLKNVSIRIDTEQAGKGRKTELAKLEKEQERLKRLQELNTVYSAYNSALFERKEYDYDDLLMQLIKTLEVQPALLALLQERFQYILVDEHQDSNRAQNTIIELLGSGPINNANPNIFVVGDIKQAIYRFQGASVANFQYFQERYPSARLIVLTENYRSSQKILDTVMPLFPEEAKLSGSLKRKELPVKVAVLPTDIEEYAYIGSLIQERIHRDKTTRIALLVRTNAQARTYATYLSRLGVPVYAEADEPILSNFLVSQLLTFIRVCLTPHNEKLLIDLLHKELFQIPILDTLRVIKAAQGAEIGLFEYMVGKHYTHLELVDVQALDTLAQHLKHFAAIITTYAPSQILAHLYRALNVDDYLTGKEHAFETWEALHLLQSEAMGIEAKQNVSVQDFLQTLTLSQEHNVVRNIRAPRVDAPVVIMTAHKAKGLEFDVVIIPTASADVWGKEKKTETLDLPIEVYQYTEKVTPSEALDDEKRLFYVALTRAREELFITLFDQGIDGKSKTISPLVELLKKDIVERVAFSEEELAGFSHTVSQLVQAQIDVQFGAAEKSFLQGLLGGIQLSASGLNTYIACPRRFLYEHVLRIRQPNEPKQVQGIIAHALLSYVHTQLQSGEPYHREQFDTIAARILKKYPLAYELQDIERYIGEVVEQVTLYSNAHTEELSRPARMEQSFSNIHADNVPFTLTGRLDKLELLEGNKVNIVDYKYKKPMSANAIRGLTANEDGAYFRQLVFYHILVSASKRYIPQLVGLEFLEPSDSGKYKREDFVITKEDVQRVKTEMVTMHLELQDGEVFNKRCDDEKCLWCKT